jgi:hypothetical protein
MRLLQMRCLHTVSGLVIRCGNHLHCFLSCHSRYIEGAPLDLFPRTTQSHLCIFLSQAISRYRSSSFTSTTNLPSHKDIHQLGSDSSRYDVLNFSTTVWAFLFYLEGFLQTMMAEGVLTRIDDFRALETTIADLGKCQRLGNFP